MALAAAVGAATAVDTDGNAAVLAGAAAATVLLALALSAGRAGPIPFAVVVLGAIYAIPEGERAIPAPLYASALLVIAELAYWSLDERVLHRVDVDVMAPRLLAVLCVSAAAVPASALALLAADADVARSPALTALGAAAVVACVALLAGLAHLRQRLTRAERAGDLPSP